jgi:site-specific recombinase XerD
LNEERDRALLAVLLAGGLRRHEAVELNFGHIQQREEHWAIVDLEGKGKPYPHNSDAGMDKECRRPVDPGSEHYVGQVVSSGAQDGKTGGETLTEKAVWHVVREYAMKAGIDKLAPHDLRRTRLAYLS